MKKALIWAIMVLAVATAVMAAYPTVTISIPATGGTFNDTNTFNFSIGVPAADAVDNTTLHNCSWYIWSAGSKTANSSSTTVLNKTIVNITREEAGNIINMNLSVNSNNYEDANDYSVKVTCTATNGTRTATDTNTGITFDNTVPTAATSVSPAHQTKGVNGSQQFEGTVTGTATTKCTLYFPNTNPGSKSYSMTHSGNNCAYTFSNLPNGVYDWYIIASDETNTTNSPTVEFREDRAKSTTGARILASGGLKAVDSEGGTAGGESGGSNTTAIVVLLLLVGGYFVAKEAKILK